jgi:hypothetical protein
MTIESNCGNCAFRAKYDNNSKSFLGKIWRWHANWCPGWKSYMQSLPEKDRTSIAKKYNMSKYM